MTIPKSDELKDKKRKLNTEKRTNNFTIYFPYLLENVVSLKKYVFILNYFSAFEKLLILRLYAILQQPSEVTKKMIALLKKITLYFFQSFIQCERKYRASRRPKIKKELSMPENLQAILLAGGKSNRFNTQKTKLTEKICGKEMILYPLDLLSRMNIPTTIVVGFEKEKVLDVISQHNIKNISIAAQQEQLGTGHAVAITKHLWTKNHILIINGDIPLMTADVIQKLYNKHIKADADISFATAHSLDDANDSYCRIVINDNKIRVIERRDENLDMEAQCCVSVGIYIMKKSFLETYIDSLKPSQLTNEFYLPELIQIASNEHCKIITTPISFDLARNVNTLAELWVVEHIKRSQIISYWMQHGVRFAHTLNIIIDADVILEPGVFIGSGAHLLGKTTIKKNANIGAFSYIESSTIEENAKIKPHVVITKSTIGQNAIIQSFSQINYEQVLPAPKKAINKSTSPLFTGAIKDDLDSSPML